LKTNESKYLRYRKPLIVGIFAVVIAIICMILLFGKTQKNNKQFTVGFVMSGLKIDEGWNQMHYMGISEACNQTNSKLIVMENISEFSGQCEQAVKFLIEQGARLIILTSNSYATEVRPLISEHPEISFYVNTADFKKPNMTTYFVRMYEARYLAGVIAGMRTKTNKIGYVAAMPTCEVNRGINAFTLGVQAVNPAAKVIVKWTDGWEDGVTEIEAAKTLIQKRKVDCITYHQNKPFVVYAADSMMIDSIGYHNEVRGASNHYLTSVICDWNKTYEIVISQVLQGKANKKTNYWFGMNEGVISLSKLSPYVNDDIKNKIEEYSEKIKMGQYIFANEIYDRGNNLRCNEGEVLSDDYLLNNMNWLIRGVEIYED